jgi:RimJ/RimL family protein N-acetyltransferase
MDAMRDAGIVVTLRPTTRDDLPALFELQRDEASNAMAGTKPRTREAYWSAWDKIFGDPTVMARTILVNGAIGGGVSRFRMEGVELLGYWVGRRHWGRGVATRAVGLFLGECTTRPLHAYVSAANAASKRVLEKHGFRPSGSFVGEETERYVAGVVETFVLGA